MDNRIKNLQCITHKKHNNIHAHPAWNKGITTHHGNNSFGHKVLGKTKTKQKMYLFNKSLNLNISIWKLKDLGESNEKIAIKLNIKKHKVNSYWRGFKKSYLVPFREGTI